jgi:hypothetical protein
MQHIVVQQAVILECKELLVIECHSGLSTVIIGIWDASKLRHPSCNYNDVHGGGSVIGETTL